MFYKQVIRNGDVNQVVDEKIVDGQLYVDEAPILGSNNPVTSDSVAKIAAVIPEGAGESNKLVSADDIQMVDGGALDEEDLDEGVLSIQYPSSFASIELTTATAITVLANEGIPNFRLLVDNSGNSSAVTVTVKDSEGVATLLHEKTGGASVGAGKVMLVSAVGSCWFLSEME